MPRTLILVPGQKGLPKVLVTGPGGSRAEVFLHGAQVTSWVTADGRERLFLSEYADYATGKAIRGGVQIIFPQVAGVGPLPKHGFARTLTWEAMEAEEGQARLRLEDSEASRAIWPRPFEAEVTIELGKTSLKVTLAVTNTGPETIQFTLALHPYLRVEDITRVTVSGLQGLRLRDYAQGSRERIETESDICFGNEIERLYFGAPQRIQLREGSRTLEISTRGFPDTLLWNPGSIEGDKLRDLEPEGYRRMICVQAAAMGTPIILAPGERWEGSQTLTAG